MVDMGQANPLGTHIQWVFSWAWTRCSLKIPYVDPTHLKLLQVQVHIISSNMK